MGEDVNYITTREILDLTMILPDAVPVARNGACSVTRREGTYERTQGVCVLILPAGAKV